MSEIITYVFIAIFWGVGIVAIPLLTWYKDHFGCTFQESMYTLASPMEGADASFMLDAFWYARYFMVIYVVALVALYTLISRGMVNALYVLLVGFVLFMIEIYRADKMAGVFEYFIMRLSRTKMYDEEYVKPENVVAGENRKNLIYIYLESMESTYASKEVGGAQPENYIPNLTRLAKENTSFSEDDKLGGFHTVPGSQWTMSAIFSTQTGVPFSFPLRYVRKDKKDLAAGITSLGDILHENGYVQEFLCGSKAGFGGRANFFKQHGNFKIFDYDSAVEKGYIDKGYHVWWGFEDNKLYKCAKDELLQLSSQGKPFNFTMLTVDTHHIGGYVCSECGHAHANKLANVLECADRQLQDFVNWCYEQDFMKDTVIVITGDHPRMDTSLVKGVDYYDRTVYNCIIGSDKTPSKAETSNREFLHMDMFPTILSALGFTIKGNRLGLGTDLYSGQKTLCEEKGFKYMRDESFKYSKYYVENFS
ncbi:MAG: LTA synthase family protein [Butyrivibrio sp.]|jgi:phosphoglycerol transferase|nr:LTA synthase family protein [Butyrivibrio sp.]